MPVSFEWGDVSEENTRPGEKVVYITGRERGHWGSSRTHYHVVEVRAFNPKGIQIRYPSGYETHVTGNHLFKIESLKTRKVSVVHEDGKRNVVGLVDSIRVARNPNGTYETLITAVDTGKEEVLGSFVGPGKMKRARELANSFYTKIGRSTD